MIPVTHPTFTNPFNVFGDCKISYLSSVSGLVAWTDYIPVQTVTASSSIEGRTEATGYQNVHPVGATGNVAWIDYIPVYEDATKTVPWSTDANGYIPIGMSEDGVLGFMSQAEFQLPLTHTAVPDEAAPGTTATFTRATTKTIENNDGYLVTLLAGEIGFPGARRVDNLIRLGAAQSSTLAIAANVTMTLPAGAYQFSMGAGTGTATFSGTGGATGTLAASASGRVFVAKTITAGTLIVTGSAAILNDIQVVSMVAETDQTTIREYVSVGVESAPYYHGSFVDGVKCFPTDLAGNPLTTMLGYSAEGARTNLVWPSEDLTHVRYVPGGGGIAVVADQAVAPDGTTTADQLTASGANGTLIQDLGVIASAAQAFSLYLKRKTGTGNIDITLDGGATWTTQAITTTEWTRCQITQTVANPDVGIRIVTSGDAIYAWGLQCE